MFNFRKACGLALAAALLAACGSSSPTSTVASTTAHGTLALNPPLRITSVNAATLAAKLGTTATGAQLLQQIGNLLCGVDFYYLTFWTQGAAGEITKSSGALMVPTGAAGTCSGPRPVVLYAHGTQELKTANIADITNPSNSEGALIAAIFAANGYIVVAPNYAGYDISTLGYHPYLNASQESGEMMDILAAARTALPKSLTTGTTDNGKLFVTGYSEGGYVALATLRAMQAAGVTVTAAAPMSGPYALEALGDAFAYGAVDLGATEFFPLLTTGYQHAYNGNIYSATTDIYSATYATGIDTLLPNTASFGALVAAGELPETQLWNSTTPVITAAQTGNATQAAELTAALAVPANPLYQLGFGSPSLLLNSFREAYVLDAASDPDGAIPAPKPGVPLATAPPSQTFRLALYKNDLRNGAWAPKVPTLLCGGDKDPTVFFSVDTLTMQAFWSLPATVLSVLDVDGTPAGTFKGIQTAFQASEASEFLYLQTAAGGGLSATAAAKQLVENYHVDVSPFCTLATRYFFDNF